MNDVQRKLLEDKVKKLCKNCVKTLTSDKEIEKLIDSVDYA